jgi:hypothetical protein
LKSKPSTLDPDPFHPAPRAPRAAPVSAWKKDRGLVAGALRLRRVRFHLGRRSCGGSASRPRFRSAARCGYVAPQPCACAGAGAWRRTRRRGRPAVAKGSRSSKKRLWGPAPRKSSTLSPRRRGREREISVATEKDPHGVWKLTGIDGVVPGTSRPYRHSGADAAACSPATALGASTARGVLQPRRPPEPTGGGSRGGPRSSYSAAAANSCPPEVESSTTRASAATDRHPVQYPGDLDYAALSHDPWAQGQGPRAAIFDFCARWSRRRRTVRPPKPWRAGPGLMMLWLDAQSASSWRWVHGVPDVYSLSSPAAAAGRDGGHVVMNLWAVRSPAVRRRRG